GDLDLDDGAEEAAEGGAEVAGEPLVQRLQGPHLVLADALGALEVIGADLDILQIAPVAAEDLDVALVLLDLAGIDRGEQGVYFTLVENVHGGSLGGEGARRVRVAPGRGPGGSIGRGGAGA